MDESIAREEGEPPNTLVSIWENSVLNESKAITFDVDPVSLLSLREALPGWQIAVVYGATVASLPCDWNPGAVNLLIVGTRDNVAETL